MMSRALSLLFCAVMAMVVVVHAGWAQELSPQLRESLEAELYVVIQKHQSEIEEQGFVVEALELTLGFRGQSDAPVFSTPFLALPALVSCRKATDPSRPVAGVIAIGASRWAEFCKERATPTRSLQIDIYTIVVGSIPPPASKVISCTSSIIPPRVRTNTAVCAP